MRNNRILKQVRASLENEADNSVINDTDTGVKANDDGLQTIKTEGEQGDVRQEAAVNADASTKDSIELPKDDTASQDDAACAPDTVNASAEEYDDLEEIDEVVVDGEPETIIPEEITEVYEDGEETSEDNEDLEVIQESLENYQALLTTVMERRGYLHPETMAAVRIGLEQIDPMCFRNLNVSFENYTEKTRKQVSLEFLDNVKDRVKSAAKTAYSALLELIDKIANLLNSLFTDAAGLEKTIASIKNSLNGVKGQSGEGTKLNIGNSGLLMVEGKSVFEDVAALGNVLTVVDILATRFPEATVKGIATIQRSKEDEQIETLYEKATDTFISEIAERHMDATTEYPEELGEPSTVYVSDELPGGFALYMSQEDMGEEKEGSIRFTFAKKSEQESNELTVPNAVAIVKTLDVCNRIVKAISDARSTSSLLNRTKAGLRDASKLEGNRKEAMDKFIKSVRSGMVSSHQFFGYLLRVVKAIIAASSVAAKQLTAPAKTEGEPKPA